LNFFIKKGLKFEEPSSNLHQENLVETISMSKPRSKVILKREN